MGVFINVTIESFQQQGAAFMWAILVAGALALTYIIYRLYYLFVKCGVNPEKLYMETLKKLDESTLDDAIEMLSKKSTPFHKMFKAILEYKNLGYEFAKRKVNIVFLSEVPKIQADATIINMTANISTLLGLLGTIIGLIMAFDAVANVEASKRAEALALGISIAMVTTAFGLMIAIPTLFVQGVIIAQSERIIEKLDEKSFKLLNKVFS